MKTQTNIAEKQNVLVVKLDAKTAKAVDKDTRKKIVDAYLELFSGFAWVNWSNGQSLGRAWQQSLDQCAAFTKTKNQSNPAAKYLNNVYEGHKKYWSRIIMTHRDSENALKSDSEYLRRMRAHGQQMIRRAMDVLNLIMAQYNARTEVIEKMQKDIAKKQAVSNAQSGQYAHKHVKASPATKPVEKAASTTTVAPEKAARPVISEKMAVPEKPVLAAKPVEMVKPDIAQKTAAAKVAEMAKPVDMAKPVLAAKPVEMAKTAIAQKPAAAKVAEMEKPVLAAKPVEMEKPKYVAPDVKVNKVASLKTAADKVGLNSMKMRMQITRQTQIFAIGQAMQHAA